MDSNYDNVAEVKKVPFYKQIWFFVVIIAVAIIFAGVFFYLGSTKGDSKSLSAATETATPTPEPTLTPATPTPEPTVDTDKWLFDITFDEWLSNVNQFRDEYGIYLIEDSDVVYEDASYDFYPNDYTQVTCMCPEGPKDDRIYVVLMAFYGYDVEDGTDIFLWSLYEIIAGFHPDYTSEEMQDIVTQLLVLDETGNDLATTDICVDETYYHLETSDQTIYFAVTPLYISN